VTTQGVSGQRTALGTASFTDARIKAALAMSRAARGMAATRSGVRWRDGPVAADDRHERRRHCRQRRRCFAPRRLSRPAAGGKYELVLNGAEHSAFSDRALPGDKEKRNPNHHRAILAVSTAFWDAWLREDADARAWLDGAGPLSVLERQDRWQRK